MTVVDFNWKCFSVAAVKISESMHNVHSFFLLRRFEVE